MTDFIDECKRAISDSGTLKLQLLEMASTLVMKLEEANDKIIELEEAAKYEVPEPVITESPNQKLDIAMKALEKCAKKELSVTARRAVKEIAKL